MLFDILTVFVVTFISSLFLCTTPTHGLTTLRSSNHHSIENHPSADVSSPLRRLFHHPVPSVDYDLGGDTSEMVIGESNEFAPTNKLDNQILSSSSFDSSLNAFNVPINFDRHSLPSKLFTRKLLSSLQKYHKKKEENQQQQEKRSIAPSSLPTEYSLHSDVAGTAFADPSALDNVVSLNQANEATRLSPSLTVLVETNPLARAWLSLLLQKVMEEQPAPYIFKYGRR